tara:strand:+ start:425 stop:1489 length:1065 start_codon:yes stop_codon:yes gene_type:complete
MFKLLSLFQYLKEVNFNLLWKLILIILKKDYSKYPKYVEDFERLLSKKFNSNYCLTFSSGTVAFYASLLALSLKKESKVLISSLTFPSVIETLKKFQFDIYYFDVNKDFDVISKNIDNQKFDLLVITHPFGFYLNNQTLKEHLNDDAKIIFDASHSQGMKINNIEHIKFADISFMSLQGNKSISGGEGGVIFTDNKNLYSKMIDNHHPGHKENTKIEIAGGINDIKLRMHPLAALIATNDLKTFDKRNYDLKNKIIFTYDCLDKFKINHPFHKNSFISGFHFGIPFFSSTKYVSEVIKNYNWYSNLKKLNIKSISTENDVNFFNELYFLDLEWIKKNNFQKIEEKINKIFKDVH